MTEQAIELADEAATHAFGRRVAAALDGGLVIYLKGDLGAGKTSLARALLDARGVGERIKSPTYSLVENYQTASGPAWHLDLYRIADPGELEWLGLDALSEPSALVLVEWPERGRGALPKADVEVTMSYFQSGRCAAMHAHTERGQQLLRRLELPDSDCPKNAK